MIHKLLNSVLSFGIQCLVLG